MNKQHFSDDYCQYSTVFHDSNFEIANRAFYATIDKFTRQSCPDASRRRSAPYSFLENWHLHSIYSKSQQTLLGITPIKPSVLLSGDDFMFTPPFIQPDEQEDPEEEEDDSDDSYYMLRPCSESSLFDCEDEFYYHPFEAAIDTWLNKPALTILIPDRHHQQSDLQSPEEPELSPCSSLDENPTTSSHSSITIDTATIDAVLPSTIKPMTKSFSILSQDDNSYQSLADLIHSSNTYGSTTDHEIHIGSPPPPQPPSLWNRLVIYLMYLWQVLIHVAWFSNTDEHLPLIP